MEPVGSISADLASYEQYVTGLDDDDHYDTFALLLLVLRDSLEGRRGKLSAAQRARLAELDRLLAAKHERVADVLPSPTAKDRRRWWWFLHEGPQVRDEALAAAGER